MEYTSKVYNRLQVLSHFFRSTFDLIFFMLFVLILLLLLLMKYHKFIFPKKLFYLNMLFVVYFIIYKITFYMLISIFLIFVYCIYTRSYIIIYKIHIKKLNNNFDNIIGPLAQLVRASC
jgi:hypothetical protein